MAKKRKMKMEFRYYQMQDGIPILALLGEKWVQNYGRDVDYLHFHNYLEIGFCYSGEGELVLGEEPVRFAGREFTIIPPNFPHTTTSDVGISANGNLCLLMRKVFCRWLQERPSGQKK